MDRGTYIAASSGLANFQKLEIVNNNLANINTPGFKRQILLTDKQSFDDTIAKQFEKEDPYARGDHERVSGVANIRAVTDFSPGPIKTNGNAMNVALRKPNQFFVVNTPDGAQYTRAGDFTLDGEGRVVTPDGMGVVGDGGDIVTDGPGIKIASNGAVLSGTTEFGKLQVVEFADPSKLERKGNNRFALADGVAAPTQVDPDLEAGALEMANVSAVSTMVEMIAANRGFEVYTRTAQSIDQLNQAAISQIGRTR